MCIDKSNEGIYLSMMLAMEAQMPKPPPKVSTTMKMIQLKVKTIVQECLPKSFLQEHRQEVTLGFHIQYSNCSSKPHR